MKTDFIRAINQVCAERGLTVEIVLELVEQALVSAYRRDFDPAQHLEAKDLSVGDALLSRLADQDIELLVMGAYGHSRLRELVLGGVTRKIFQQMTVPVLMSH